LCIPFQLFVSTFSFGLEAIGKGIDSLNVYMWVSLELEDALASCQDYCDEKECSMDAVRSWDKAVAYMAGSLEGPDGLGQGVFLYGLADKQCVNFKTCGDLADANEGTAHTNIELIRQFEAGVRHLLTGKCSAARDNKKRIEQLMAVPLIQSTLRYAYINEFEVDAGDQEDAQGATFAAAILPLIHFCDPDDAQRIYDEMKIGTGRATSYVAVKGSLERNYPCLGLRCGDVGGLWDPVSRQHFVAARPCSSGTSRFGNTPNKSMFGMVVTLTLGAATLLL
jgi:hypothetical protein